MTRKNDEKIIGTHARITLSDWHVLAKLIAKHGALIKDRPQQEGAETESTPSVLSQREIDDAFNGPLQHFFKQASTTYAAIARVRIHLNMREDEAFKDKRADIPEEDKVPENILEQASISDLNKIQNELDDLMLAQSEHWEQCLEAWNNHLLQRLSDIGLSLSDIEIKEFYDPEPISELSDRFVSLNIPLPKMRKSEMNFSTYLTLKSDIAIQSALSRQHLPHQQSDIQKLLKQLKTDFNDIRQQEQEILMGQKAASTQVIANITW